jgi:bifunctional DNA-binding transcriptional regulator/antitoxin component of YhaV-PrlF toxin-antitoxin module
VTDRIAIVHIDLAADTFYADRMNTVLTEDGKISLPDELRKDAKLQPGDTLEVQLYKGTIVMRKREPLTAEQCAVLLEQSRSQPKPGPEDEAAVEAAIREVRARRR